MGESLLEVGHPFWTQGERGTIWPLNKHSQAYAASLVVKTGPGKLYGFTVYNSNVATQFIQLHDCNGMPANGAIPCLFFPLATVSAYPIGFGDVGRAFDSGCVIVNSSTGPTLTIGSADCFFDAQYV